VSFDAGAKLHYVGNALRNLRVADLPPASVLAILGATGSIGVATIKVAATFGVTRLVLIGRSSQRLEEVRALTNLPVDIVATDTLGETWAETGALARRLAEVAPTGVDALIDYLTDAGPFVQAASAIATGGTLVNMGGGQQPFSLPMRALVGKCLKLAGTRNHSRFDAKEALRLMDDGTLSIEELITHRRPLREVEAAVAALSARSATLWMSVVNP
jgi:threonine dehydrogenase-like Zn-dependent dehydrogenase